MKSKGHVIRFEIKNPEEEQALWDLNLNGEFSASMTGFDWYIATTPEKAVEIADKSGLEHYMTKYRMS